MESFQRRSIGYPTNQHFAYDELVPFLDFSANNVGDPFSGSNVAQNTHAFEREVIEAFAGFVGSSLDESWGYVTNGGTEGNMYGLFLARELNPDGIVYFSEATHYSVPKILRLQNTRNIMIRAEADGTIDYEDLRETLRIRRDVPPIVFANIGTTMTGAVDDVGRIQSILDELAIRRSYIHADAALAGMLLPFVPDPPRWHIGDGADSVSISGHKVIGAPIPCGVVLARRESVERIARSVEYVGALDTTIMGSRNALTPLMLWTALRRFGQDGLTQLTRTSLDHAAYAVDRLRSVGIDAWCHPNSITVVFPRPPEALFDQWVLAPYRDICHIITLPHVSPDVIDEFVSDFAQAIVDEESRI